MSKLHALICDCLPLFLKETVLKFIEDESWKIDKKHSKKVRRVLKILPHYHTKMYNLLAFKKNRLYLSEQDARAGIRILRRMMRWLFFCHKLKIYDSIMFFKYLCNQSRILSIYSIRSHLHENHEYGVTYETWEITLSIHQEFHRILSSMNLTTFLNEMLTVDQFE